MYCLSSALAFSPELRPSARPSGPCGYENYEKLPPSRPEYTYFLFSGGGGHNPPKNKTQNSSQNVFKATLCIGAIGTQVLA